MKWLDGARARLRLLLDRPAAESRAAREFRFHIEMETEQLMRDKGLAHDEARRLALAAFGGVEKHKEALRDGRGLAWLRGWSLNVKLGARMFAKYPGVTIVGVVAMAIGIGLGAAYLEGVNDFLHPTLPFEESDGIVGLQNWDLAQNAPDRKSTRDFLAWQAELRSVRHLGAYRDVERNVGPLDAAGEPARGAEITASAFEVTRVPTQIGRPLLQTDESVGSPPVVVLGHQVWRNRFRGDPAIVGRPVRVGRSQSIVVGVMPEGYAFPVSHDFWIPLRPNAAPYEWRQGPGIRIFGRLVPGVSLAEAQAELSTLGTRVSRDMPATHEHLRPQIMRYTDLFVGDDDNWRAYLGELGFVMLLLVLGSNVATMVFARTATRENEIAMRFALGASRGQLLAQFFAEALVLGLAAALVGLLVVAWASAGFARFVWDITEGQVPFWLDDRLNPTTVAYALLLAVLVSLVAGVMPALKATSTRARARLRHSPGSGESALRFGGLWSAMIVVQVAFAVLVVPPAIVAVRGLGQPDHADPGFAAGEYLSGRLEMETEQADGDGPLRANAFREFEAASEELRRRLLMRPDVSRVTFATRLPGMAHPEAWVDVDSGTTADASDEFVTASAVATDYFDTFGAPILMGRGFSSGDVSADARVVVVNEYLVADILQGRNAIGRRIRYTTRYGEQSATGRSAGLPRAAMREPGDWYEIVGVVKNIGMDTTKDAFASGKGPGIYHPLTPAAMASGAGHGVRVAFHVRGDAGAFASTFREVAQAVHPALRVYDVLTLDGPVDRVSRAQRRFGRITSAVTAFIALLALLISVAGIYSVMSFTVSRQTRDIGIRIALGADTRRIVAGVFSRAMMQVAAGIAIGTVLWFYVIVVQLGGGGRVWLLLTTAVVLVGLGLIACGIPVRRALRIEPTEALRTIG